MPVKKIDTYIQARRELIDYILNAYTLKSYHRQLGVHDDTATLLSDIVNGAPPIGSLVIPTSTREATKYSLSWLIDIKPADSRFDVQYLLKSTEDQSTCWWSNIGFYYLPLSVSEQFIRWKWSDRQFEFQKSWEKAAEKVFDYWTVACSAEFTDDGGVILSTRQKFKNDRTPYKLENWKKLTQKAIISYFKNNTVPL